MDNTSSIRSLTTDILDEVSSQEKTAEAKQEFRTEIGKALVKISEELREYAEADHDISYDDLKSFTDRMNGLV